MAQSTWASGLQVDRWARQLYYEATKEIYFQRFMGDDPGSMIQTKHELDGGEGKKLTFGLITNMLSGTTNSVSGDDVLEGNETAWSTYNFNITTQMERNAIRNTGEFDDSKVLYDFRREALALLRTWLAEFVDANIHNKLDASPTRSFRATGSSESITSRIGDAKADLDGTGALITPADISALKKFAKIPPGANELKIRPLRVGGRMYYVLLVHPQQAYDLQRNSEWAQAQREARSRGDDNPLFTGALGEWDGVVVHEHELVTTFANGGSGANINGASALFMGAQAGVFGRVGRPIWREKSFDYGNQLGIAGGLIFAAGKPKFNSEDYAVIAYHSANSKLS